MGNRQWRGGSRTDVVNFLREGGKSQEIVLGIGRKGVICRASSRRLSLKPRSELLALCLCLCTDSGGQRCDAAWLCSQRYPLLMPFPCFSVQSRSLQEGTEDSPRFQDRSRDSERSEEDGNRRSVSVASKEGKWLQVGPGCLFAVDDCPSAWGIGPQATGTEEHRVCQPQRGAGLQAISPAVPRNVQARRGLRGMWMLEMIINGIKCPRAGGGGAGRQGEPRTSDLVGPAFYSLVQRSQRMSLSGHN